MKNLFKNLMLVAVAAMAFVGCEQDIEVNATTEKTAVRVIAGLDETRSGFGDKINGAYDQVWNGGEVLSYHHFNYEQYTTDNSNVTLPEGESKKAEFNIELTGVGNASYSTGVIRIASPASSATAVNGGFTIKVPTEQTPLANSVDPAAHILTSVVDYYDGVPSTIEAQFEHAVAYGKMTLNNLPEGNYDYVTISLDNKTYKLYTTNVQNNVFWFGCEAVKPAEVKVSVVNETENVAYTKTLDLTKATNFEFVTGRLGSFSVEMNGVEPTTPEVADTFNPDVVATKLVWNNSGYFVLTGEVVSGTAWGHTSDYIRIWLNSANRPNNNSIVAGTYTGCGGQNPNETQFGARSSLYWGNVTYPASFSSESTLKVSTDGGVYTIILTHNGVTYGYKGLPEGWPTPSGSEGGEEPEQPVEPEQPEQSTIKETYNVTWEYYLDLSGTMPYGHAWNVNSNDGGFSAKITTDSRNNYTTATSFTPGTYNYHPQYADGNYADGMWFTMAAFDIIIEGTTYGAYDFDGKMTVVANNGAYDITVDLYSATDSTKITTLVGTFGTSTGGDTEPITPLTTPSNLKVTYNGTSATITWDAVEGVDYYGVTYGSTATNTLTNSVTLEGLSYNTDYTVNVVAYPSNTTLHTSSEAASITINIGEDPNAGGGDEPESNIVNLTSVSYSLGSKDITFSSANDTITGNIAYTGSFPSGTFKVVEGEPNTGEIGNIKLNGNTVSPEGSVNASVNYLTGSIEFNVSIVINETTYSGTVAAKLQ